jgi:pilus assembly protein CpaB
MNVKTWAPLAIASVLGIAAAKFAFDMTGNSTPSEAKAVDTDKVSVVLAVGDVPPGTALSSEHLKSVEVEKSVAPSAALRDVTSAVGRVTLVKLSAGTPIVEDFLAPAGATAGLSALLPNGARAITLRIDEITGVGGFLVPGCRVDVVSTLGGAGGEETASVTVVQNVPVLAVGGRFAPGQPRGENEPISSVTLVVTPEQAQAIDLVASTAQTRVVLRSNADGSTSELAGVTVAQLRRQSKPTDKPLAQASNSSDPFATPISTTPTTRPIEAPSFRTVRIILGGQESEQRVPLSNSVERGGAVAGNNVEMSK